MNFNLADTDYDTDANYYNTLTSSISNSEYYTYEAYNLAIDHFRKTRPDVSLHHCNIRSATNNGNNLSYELSRLKYGCDIIALTETWLDENNTDIVGLPGYNHSRALVSCANGLCYCITPMCYLFIMSDFRTLPIHRLSSS